MNNYRALGFGEVLTGDPNSDADYVRAWAAITRAQALSNFASLNVPNTNFFNLFNNLRNSLQGIGDGSLTIDSQRSALIDWTAQLNQFNAPVGVPDNEGPVGNPIDANPPPFKDGPDGVFPDGVLPTITPPITGLPLPSPGVIGNIENTVGGIVDKIVAATGLSRTVIEVGAVALVIGGLVYANSGTARKR